MVDENKMIFVFIFLSFLVFVSVFIFSTRICIYILLVFVFAGTYKFGLVEVLRYFSCFDRVYCTDSDQQHVVHLAVK